MKFEPNDFFGTVHVQVKHSKLLANGEPNNFWRNALYVCQQDDAHVVIYADGTKEVLKQRTKIRMTHDGFNKPLSETKSD